MTARQPSIYDHPWLAERLGLNLSELGCVMLPVDFTAGVIERGYEIGLMDRSELYFSEDPARWWIKGDVREKAHVTLLYGLLTPAYEQEETIERLFDDWRAPTSLPILEYTAFPSPFADEPYSCIVASIGDDSGALQDARDRLQYLPHVLAHPEWRVHATLAYVHADAADAWLSFLNNRSSAERDRVDVRLRDGRAVLDLGRTR